MNPSSLWTLLCTSAQSHATMTASQCSAEVGEVIVAETRKFCQQPPPISKEELAVRYMQSGALTSIKVANMTYADSTARSHPAVARLILDAARDLCQRQLPMNRQELAIGNLQSGALISIRIANLTYADTTARSHPSVAEFILDATKALCAEPLPTNRDELAVRHLQSRALIGVKIANLTYAADTANAYPAIASLIFEASAAIRNLKLPISSDELKAQHQVALAFTATVSQIVYDHTQRKFRLG
jgi:hypothetical protein